MSGPRMQRTAHHQLAMEEVSRVVTLRDGQVHYRKGDHLLCVSDNPRLVTVRPYPGTITCRDCLAVAKAMVARK